MKTKDGPDYGAHHERQIRSGKSRRQYCTDQGLSYSGFNYWLRRKAQETSGFRELAQPEPGVNEVARVVLELGNNCRILFYGPVEARYVGELIKELGHAGIK